MIDVFDLYNNMERNDILLSFKGAITSELLTSVLQIMEEKMEDLNEEPKTKKKVFNVLVECLQNLYHHIDDFEVKGTKEEISKRKSAIFMISRHAGYYNIITGNFIGNDNIEKLRGRIDHINSLERAPLSLPAINSEIRISNLGSS